MEKELTVEDSKGFKLLDDDNYKNSVINNTGLSLGGVFHARKSLLHELESCSQAKVLNIEKYIEIDKERHSHFKIRPAHIEPSGPLIVGDANYAMTLINDKDNAVEIMHENSKICDLIVKVLKGQSNITLEDSGILKMLT